MEHPLHKLSREDLDLVMELVLKSGSIKDLALSYGVSYPTMRTRLDRVIERLQAVRDGTVPDQLTLLLAHLVERGELAPGAARSIRDTAREVQNQRMNQKGSTSSGGIQ
jgi:hypothetical protein